jgi:hypothetical protein
MERDGKIMTEENSEKHFAMSESGIVITFSNGWWLDASIGAGCYCDNHNIRRQNLPEVIESEDCETIVQDNLGRDRTLEIGEILNIRVEGNEATAIMPYLRFEDWLRVFDYVRAQERVKE